MKREYINHDCDFTEPRMISNIPPAIVEKNVEEKQGYYNGIVTF